MSGTALVVVYGLVRQLDWWLPALVLGVRIKCRLLVELLLLCWNRVEILSFGALDILDDVCETAGHRRPAGLGHVALDAAEGYDVSPALGLHRVHGVERIQHAVSLEFDLLGMVDVGDVNFAVPDIGHHVLLELLGPCLVDVAEVHIVSPLIQLLPSISVRDGALNITHIQLVVLVILLRCSFFGDLGLQEVGEGVCDEAVAGWRHLRLHELPLHNIFPIFIRRIVFFNIPVLLEPRLLRPVVHHACVVVGGGAGVNLLQLLLFFLEFLIDHSVVAAELVAVVGGGLGVVGGVGLGAHIPLLIVTHILFIVSHYF